MNREHMERLYAADLDSGALIRAFLARLLRTARWQYPSCDEDAENDPCDRAVLVLREIVPMLEKTATKIVRGGGPGFDNGSPEVKLLAELEDLELRAVKALSLLYGPTLKEQAEAKYMRLPRGDDGRPVI